MKRSLPFLLGLTLSFSMAGALGASAFEAPSWLQKAAERIQAVLPTRTLTEKLPLTGNPRMAECAALIGRQTAACSAYENWMLDIQISNKATGSAQTQIEAQEILTGPANKCLGTRAGWKYPVEIQSEILDTQQMTEGGEQQTVCSVSCSGWVCPEEEGEKERTYTCKAGTMKPEDCSRTCPFKKGYSCKADLSQDFPCERCLPFDVPVEEPVVECEGWSSPTDECEETCAGVCQPEPGRPGCSSCTEWTDEDMDTPTERTCAFPAYPDCRGECAGLPSYPTYEFEDCLTACDLRYNNDVENYNRCMGE